MNKYIKKLIGEEFTGKNGFYHCLLCDNIEDIKLFLEQRNLKFSTKYYPHVSVISSKTIPTSPNFIDDKKIEVKGKKFSILGENLVIIIDSIELVDLNKKWIKNGCESIYEEYIPHISIIDGYTNRPYLDSKDELFKEEFNITIKLKNEIIDDLEI